MRAFLLLSAYHLLAPQLVTSEEYEKLRCGLSAKVSRLVAEEGEGPLSNRVSGRDVRVLLASSPDAWDAATRQGPARQRMSSPAV